jgi:hypothetical protein
MNRQQLKELAERCGHDPVKMRAELEAYFDTPVGQKDLDNAPRAMLYTTGNDGVTAHETNKELVISLLMQEFKGGG